MSADNRGISEARPPAFRLLASAIEAPPGEPWMVKDRSDVAMIPSGTARLAVLQSTAVAAVAIQRLAEESGRSPREVLYEIWPEKARSTDAQRALPGSVVWGEIECP